MSAYPLEQRLADAGKGRRRAEEDRAMASRLLRAAVREAGQENWPKTRIAEVAGVSRQTVHEMLRD